MAAKRVCWCRAGGAAKGCVTARATSSATLTGLLTHLHHHHHVTPRAGTFTFTFGTQDTLDHTSITGAIVTHCFRLQNRPFKVIIYKWSFIHHTFPADVLLGMSSYSWVNGSQTHPSIGMALQVSRPELPLSYETSVRLVRPLSVTRQQAINQLNR